MHYQNQSATQTYNQHDSQFNVINKKIIELIKKFLFGNKVEKAVAVAQVAKEVKKTSVKIKTGSASKKK